MYINRNETKKIRILSKKKICFMNLIAFTKKKYVFKKNQCPGKGIEPETLKYNEKSNIINHRRPNHPVTCLHICCLLNVSFVKKGTRSSSRTQGFIIIDRR